MFLAVGALLAVLLPSLPPIAASLLTLSAMAPPFYIAWAYPVPPPLVPLEYTLLAILILFSVNVLSSYFVETHEKQKLVDAFGHYVPPALVAELSRQPEAFSMASEARDLSVMFCDIKSFSRISEELEPRELAEMINVYLTAMTDVLHGYGATIDKYIGDAIMAFWGAPVAQDDHATRAVNCALAMQLRMKSLREEFSQRGWPALEIGIGINSGVMNVGNMGSRYRIAYTVLGDAVNLAARLEGLTRAYRVAILVSAATKSATPDTRFREIDHVRVKGRGMAGRVFEPLTATTSESPHLQDEALALAAYDSGDWKTAVGRFQNLLEIDSSVFWYEVMLSRMARDTLPSDWDGIITFGGELNYSMDAPTQHERL